MAEVENEAQGEQLPDPVGRQLHFCLEYLVDCNATRAYSVAYKQKDLVIAGACAHRLIKSARVKAYIARRQKTVADKVGITQERVLREYARVAFADPRQVADWGGEGNGGLTLKDSKELSDDVAAAVAEVTVEITDTGIKRKFKMHDKVGALKDCAKHLGLVVEKHEHGVSDDLAALILKTASKGPA
jgi:phage terminase small subunit